MIARGAPSAPRPRGGRRGRARHPQGPSSEPPPGPSARGLRVTPTECPVLPARLAAPGKRDTRPPGTECHNRAFHHSRRPTAPCPPPLYERTGTHSWDIVAVEWWPRRAVSRCRPATWPQSSRDAAASPRYQQYRTRATSLQPQRQGLRHGRVRWRVAYGGQTTTGVVPAIGRSSRGGRLNNKRAGSRGRAD